MTTNHLSDETLAAFIDGRTDPETRERVIEHMATCSDCYSIYESAADYGALEMEEEPEPAPVMNDPKVYQGDFGEKRTWRAGWSVAAAVIVGLVALSPFATRIFHRQTDVELVARASKALETRPIDARLSGGFPFIRREPTVRGPNEQELRTDRAALNNAVLEIQQKMGNRPSTDSLRALAASQLLVGEADMAVEFAEQALKLDTGEDNASAAIAKSKNAALLTDVAAAYYERSRRRGDHPTDLPRASEAIQNARRLSATPEVIWNFALIVDALGMREDARNAWGEYLRLDSTSPWAGEARVKLDRLKDTSDAGSRKAVEKHLADALAKSDEAGVRALVVRYPAESRMFVENTLFPKWGEAVLRGEDGAVELQQARVVSDAVRDISGDRLASESAAAIAAAPPNRRMAVAAAHRDYPVAVEVARREPTRAIAQYEAVAAALARIHSPFVHLVNAKRLGCVHRATSYAEMLRESEALPSPESLVSRGYVAAAALTEGTRGVAQLELGFPDEASRSYSHALVWFDRLGEFPNVGTIRALAAQAADALGDHDAALVHRLTALQLRGQSTDVLNSNNVLTEAGLGFTNAGYTQTAALVLDRLVRLAMASGQANQLCTAILWRSYHRAVHADVAGARRDFDEATRACDGVKDPNVRQRLRENQDLVAQLLEQTNTDAAIGHLTPAIDFAERTGSRFRSALLYARRAKTYLGMHDATHAREDAHIALSRVGDQLSHVTHPEFRASLVEGTRQVVEAVVEVELASGDQREAFQAAEWQRDQVLALDLRNGGQSGGYYDAAAPLSLEQLQSRLAPDAALLTYHTGPSRLTIFAIRRTTADARAVNVTQAQLDREVKRLRTAILRDDAGGTADASRSLYALAIAPSQALIAGARTLLIVPDGPLSAMPFALLRDGSGKLLVETYTLLAYPTARMLLRPAEDGQAAEGTTLLVAGAPAVRKDDVRLTLPDRELTEIAALYPHPRLLRGTQATPEAILEGLEQARIVHYAGHAITNDRQPARSSLVLTGANGEPAYLFAHQIARRSLQHCRMVMLAGCATAKRDVPLRMLSSVAQTFLVAGAESVVGTLWDVEDSAGLEMSRRVHHLVASGATPASAVRTAQLEMLHSSSPEWRKPRAWASLLVLGGADGKSR